MFRPVMLTAMTALAVTIGGAASGAASGEKLAGEDPGPVVRYDDHRLVRVGNPLDWSDMLELGAESHSCMGVGPHFRIPPAAMAAIDEARIPYELVHENLQARVDAEKIRLAEVAARGAGSYFDDFRRYEEINAQIDVYVAQRPDLVEKLTVGTTHEGRTVYGMKITGPGADKPAVLFNACQHAREWLASSTTMYIADSLVNRYDTDPQVQSLVDAVEVYIVPLVNADGYVYSWDFDRYQRKNRHDYDGQCTGRFIGVDLNRNWPKDYNGGESTSTDSCSEIYIGPMKWSEPESLFMRDFIQARPNLALHIDFHTYAQLILQPWGYTNELPPNYDLIDGLGAAMSAAMFDATGRTWPHGSGESNGLYLASGIFPDWTTDIGLFGYTFELVGNDFVVSPTEIVPSGEEGLAAALTMMQWAASGVLFSFPDGQPTIIDADTPLTLAVDAAPLTSGDLDTTSGRMFSRVGAGAYTESPLTHLGGTQYEASLPAVPCGNTLEYYFEIDTLTGETFSGPFDAPTGLYEAQAFDVVLTFADDFEADNGWTVTNDGDLTDGAWERGLPVNCSRGDPPADGDGSGQCFVTDNSSANACNSDVDGGATTLTSPVLDGSDPNAVLSYRRWYDNSFGGDPFNDVLVVEASDDGGGSWVLLETVGPSGGGVTGGWIDAAFTVADVPGLTNTSQLRVRFTVSDLGAGSVIEAGVDDVRVTSVSCDDPIGCTADLTGPAGPPDGNVDALDFLVLIGQWGTPCAGPCDADMTGPSGLPDGNVDSLDFLLLISEWGTPGNCAGP